MRETAVFIEIDGALVSGFPKADSDPDHLPLIPGETLRGLRFLGESGHLLFLTWHRPQIADGVLSGPRAARISQMLQQLLQKEGIPIIGILLCPHAPSSGCSCARHRPGLLIEAARQHDLQLSGSWVIGSHLDDVEAGNRAGCRTILIADPGASDAETEWNASAIRLPHRIAGELEEAARIALREEPMSPPFLGSNQGLFPG